MPDARMIAPSPELPDQYRSPEELVELLENVLHELTICWVHGGDSDDPLRLGQLLATAGKVRKSVAEVYQRVEDAFVSCAGEKKIEVPGVGVIEVVKRTKRTEWDHESLWKDVCLAAQKSDQDPLQVLWEAARPSWRLTPLRALGLDPGEYCRETPDGYGVRMPSRELEDTF